MKQLTLIVFIFSLTAKLCSQTDSVYTGNKPKVPKSETKQKPDRSWQNKITYGGNFQAYVGNPTFIYLSPSIGYRLTDNLNVGVGVIYNYTRANYGAYGRYAQSIFGGHSYARYNVTPSFFLQGQYDKLLQPNIYSFNYPDAKIWVDYVMAGGGYSVPVGDKVVLNTSLMYNFTYDPKYSIYLSPYVFQVGFVARIR